MPPPSSSAGLPVGVPDSSRPALGRLHAGRAPVRRSPSRPCCSSPRQPARWALDPPRQQRNQADALVQALHHARSEAIKRGHRVDLCPSADGATCDAAGRWELGWLLFDDPDRDGERDAGEAIVRAEARAGQRHHGARQPPGAGYVSFTAQGLARLASGALQMGTFTVCKPGLTRIEVVLANGGRPRMQEVPVRCP